MVRNPSVDLHMFYGAIRVLNELVVKWLNTFDNNQKELSLTFISWFIDFVHKHEQIVWFE
jgi:hypothetical protein